MVNLKHTSIDSISPIKTLIHAPAKIQNKQSNIYYLTEANPCDVFGMALPVYLQSLALGSMLVVCIQLAPYQIRHQDSTLLFECPIHQRNRYFLELHLNYCNTTLRPPLTDIFKKQCCVLEFVKITNKIYKTNDNNSSLTNNNYHLLT